MGSKFNDNTYVDFDELYATNQKATVPATPASPKNLRPAPQPTYSKDIAPTISKKRDTNEAPAPEQPARPGVPDFTHAIKNLTADVLKLQQDMKNGDFDNRIKDLVQSQNDMVDTMNTLIDTLIEKGILEASDDTDDGDDVEDVTGVIEDIIEEGDDDDFTEEYDEDDDEVAFESSEAIPDELVSSQPESVLESPDGPGNEIRNFVEGVDDEIIERDIQEYVPTDYRRNGRKKQTINDRRVQNQM